MNIYRLFPRLRVLRGLLDQKEQSRNVVNSYKFGEIVVNDEKYTEDVAILKSGEVREWRRKEGHMAYWSDVQPYINKDTETIIIGTGDSGMLHVCDGVYHWTKEGGVDLKVANSNEAWKMFNDAGSNSVLLIHLTC